MPHSKAAANGAGVEMVGLQDKTNRLPWDNFVPDEEDSNVHLHIDRFRETEWPNILRDLAKEPYNVVLPEGLTALGCSG